MAYTVLARKYRSWTFDELVGQEAVATTLKNAIEGGRIHHGFLFCGTRGVGKTSAARILARSLNCLKSEGPTTKPCCACESCLMIAEGQDVDVIEIDAASNTGVDNIRELRSNAVYRPARSRFKIYIIDEVHMLSTGAFNALLKTLEEPPGHVKFIMATTEPQKVPATIQSRCLRFDFRSISADQIAAHFTGILKKEDVKVDVAVVRRVARLANGSMRDGLSLLDQLLAMGADRITMEMVEDILPTSHDEALARLIGQLADRDAAGALVTLDQCLASGYSLERFAESLAEQLRALMLLRVCGPDTPLVDLPAAVAEAMQALAQRFDADGYVFMIAVLEELRRNIRFSALGRALTEAALVRLAEGATYRSIQSLLDELETGQPGAAGESARPMGAPVSATPQAAGRASAQAAKPAAPASGVVPTKTVPKSTGGKGKMGARTAGGAGGSPTPEDMKAATSEPLVRQALDLFDGTLINVERTEDAARPKEEEE